MSKPQRVEGVGRLGGHLGQERRVGVGHEQPEALLEMMHLGPLGVGGDLRAAGPALAAGEGERRLLRDARVGDQLVVDLQRDAVAHEEAGDRRHLLGRSRRPDHASASAVSGSASVNVASLASRGSGTGVTQGQSLAMKKA